VGDKMIKNLEHNNVFQDCGQVRRKEVDKIEQKLNVKFPTMYKEFIGLHNGADLNARIFDYFDTARNRITSNSIGFKPIETIERTINSLKRQSIDDPDYFFEKLIPFGENGGGDLICFNYRNHGRDNPPIIIWSHDVSDNSKRISFIANNFEEFINMLHEPEDG
jgi:cell wall assembly regulator SMI1